MSCGPNSKSRFLSVLQIIGSADPKLGGPIEAIKQHAQYPSTTRFDVTIVSLDDPAAEFVRESTVRLIALGSQRVKNFRGGFCLGIVMATRQNLFLGYGKTHIDMMSPSSMGCGITRVSEPV